MLIHPPAERVERAASGFAALGLVEGDVIAVMLRNEPVYLEAMYAARALGAYLCPINWHFRADEAGYILRDSGAPVGFGGTHSVRLPGGQGTSSGGQREFVPVLARAAVAVGIAGLFMETHPDPANALSDGPNAVPLKHMRALLEQLLALDRVVKSQPLLENDFSC